MKDQFVPYALALKLKELGFDEPCLAYFNSDEEFIYGLNIKDITFTKKYHKETDSVLAPLWQQAFDWFRINKKTSSYISSYDTRDYDIFYFILILHKRGKEVQFDGTDKSEKGYESYEEARLECLKKLIEIVDNGR